MADGVKVKFPDLERSLEKLRTVAPSLNEALLPVLQKSGDEVVDVAQTAAPKRRGRYARSINARPVDSVANFQDRNYVSPATGKRVSRFASAKRLKIKNTAVSASVAVGIFAKWVWHFIEFGTVHNPAQPHLFPAFRLLRKRIVNRTRRAMGAAIKGAFRR